MRSSRMCMILEVNLCYEIVFYAMFQHMEEYFGLANIPIWGVITEEEYQKLKGHCKAIPFMAIVVIKYDEHNRPKCA
jgi:hypothetical protein